MLAWLVALLIAAPGTYIAGAGPQAAPVAPGDHLCPRGVQNVRGIGIVRRPVIGAFDTESLVGDRPTRAEQVAESHGCTVRVAIVDGKRQVLTMDLRTNRINVAVRDGRIVRVLKVA